MRVLPVSPIIVNLVHLLLRKLNRAVKIDRWERALQRFAHIHSHKDGWELERFGFKQAHLQVKINVIKVRKWILWKTYHLFCSLSVHKMYYNFQVLKTNSQKHMYFYCTFRIFGFNVIFSDIFKMKIKLLLKLTIKCNAYSLEIIIYAFDFHVCPIGSRKREVGLTKQYLILQTFAIFVEVVLPKSFHHQTAICQQYRIKF